MKMCYFKITLVGMIVHCIISWKLTSLNKKIKNNLLSNISWELIWALIEDKEDKLINVLGPSCVCDSHGKVFTLHYLRFLPCLSFSRNISPHWSHKLQKSINYKPSKKAWTWIWAQVLISSMQNYFILDKKLPLLEDSITITFIGRLITYLLNMIKTTFWWFDVETIM